MATRIGSAFFDVTFNTAAARREVTALVSTVNRNLGLIGGVALVGGVTAIAGLTRATVELGQAALDASISYEQAFAGVRKTLDTGELSASQAAEVFGRLNDELRQVALDTPLDLDTDIAKVAELGGQLGIAAEDIVEFTKVISEVGVTTNITVDDAAINLARLANILQIPESGFRDLGDQLINLGNNLATQEDAILRFGTRIAATGQIVGLTSDEVLAIAGAFSAVGVPAERGGTAVQRTLIEIEAAVAQGTEALEGFAETAGLSVDEFSNLWQTDASEAFNLFIEGLGEAGPRAFGILDELNLGTVRARGTLLSLAGAGPLLREAFEFGADSAGALARESGIFFSTTQANLKLLENTVNDAGITIGDELNEPFNELIDSTREWIQQNPELIRSLGENLAGALEGVTPVILTVVDAVGELALAWTTLVASFNEAPINQPGFFRPGEAEVALPGLSPAQEFQDFIQRGFAFDPSLVQLDRAFSSVFGRIFFPVGNILDGFVDDVDGAMTLAEATIRDNLRDGVEPVDSLVAGFTRLQEELESLGAPSRLTGEQFAELADEAELTDDQLKEFINTLIELGFLTSIPVELRPGDFFSPEAGRFTGSGSGIGRRGGPGAFFDWEQWEADQEEAAAATELFNETLGSLLELSASSGISMSTLLSNVGRIAPELAPAVDTFGTARFQIESFSQALSGLANEVDFDLSPIYSEIDALEDSFGNQELHGREVIANLTGQLNEMAEFEANLFILAQQGFDDLVALLESQDLAHAAEDFVTGFADPAAAENLLEEGGTLGEDTAERFGEALANAELTPELLQFATGFTSAQVQGAVLSAGQLIGDQYGTAIVSAAAAALAQLPFLFGGLTIPFPGISVTGNPARDDFERANPPPTIVFNSTPSANSDVIRIKNSIRPN